MSCRHAGLWVVVAGALCCLGLVAEVVEVSGERYNLILDRNPFGLTDPPPAPVAPPAAPTNPPPVKVNLQVSGISEGPGGKYAWLVVPVTPGKNTNTLYWKVEEGGSQGDVSVLAINTESQTVEVENAGVRAVLSLEDDSPMPMGPATASGKPGARPRTLTRPGARPAIPVPRARKAGGSAANRTVVPSSGNVPRNVPSASFSSRTVGRSSTPQTLRSGTSANTSAGRIPSPRTVPSRPVRTAQPQAEPVDPAVQWLMLRAQEEQARSQGVVFPPTPPVPGIE